MKNITSSSTCSTGLLQLQNNLSCSELEVAEKTEQQAVGPGTIPSPWTPVNAGPPGALGSADTNGSMVDSKNLDVGDMSDDEKDLSSADAEGVWSPDIEQSFQEALSIYPPCGRRKIILSDEGKMYGRNELIARYIKLRTGKTRTRKQVSSHIQVLARRKLREIQAKIKVETNGVSLHLLNEKEQALQVMSTMTSSQIVSAQAANNLALAASALSAAGGGGGGVHHTTRHLNLSLPPPPTHHRHSSAAAAAAAAAGAAAAAAAAAAIGSHVPSAALVPGPPAIPSTTSTSSSSASPRQQQQQQIQQQQQHHYHHPAHAHHHHHHSHPNLTHLPHSHMHPHHHQHAAAVAAVYHLQQQQQQQQQQLQQQQQQQQQRANHTDNDPVALGTGGGTSEASPAPPAPPPPPPPLPHPPLYSGQFWQPGLQPSTSQDIKPFPQPPYPAGKTSTAVSGDETGIPPSQLPWEGRAIATHKFRLLEFTAFMEIQRDEIYHRHLFVQLGGKPSFSDPLLETVDIRQIFDKFPEKSGGLKDLYEKGPQNAFYLVKCWADLNTDLTTGSETGDFYGVTSQYESNENVVLVCSTIVCSFGKQVVEKVESEYSRLENNRYVYRIQRSPMCEYMINFIQKLKNLPERYMMNSVLENFTILQVMRARETQETLLCIAYVFEVAAQNSGTTHHIYRLIKE
ncbi:protein scalloped isoform X2 [Drosophila sechellia]|uniref:protein scalloped isoform X2 n=1 Tax=Drosophila sechellia TaxID=7238 RepID=UPI0013DE0CD7|nr:protein scalloped isoform X2 [Drosophila sechellia]